MGFFKSLRKQEWENICIRCGLCCHEKTVSFRTTTYHLDSPCIMLDTDTNLCKAYSNRFKEHTRCKPVNLFKAMFASYLPHGCAYVQWAEKNNIRFVREMGFFYIPHYRGDTKLDD